MKNKATISVENMAKSIAAAVNGFRLDCSRPHQNFPYNGEQFREILTSHGCRYIEPVITILVKEQIVLRTRIKHPKGRGNLYLYSFSDPTKPVVWKIFAPIIDKYRKGAERSNKGRVQSDITEKAMPKLQVLERPLLIKLVKSSDIAINELYDMEDILRVAIPFINENYIMIERK